MSDLLDAFEDRKKEVNEYLDFLSMLDKQITNGIPRFEGSDRLITPAQQQILYSVVYLQLYNVVEAMISICIREIENATRKEQKLKPSDLNENLRREWVRSKARTHIPLAPENRLDSALKLFDFLIDSLPIDNSFKIEVGGGGNWDDVTIKKFTERLGVELIVSSSVNKSIKKPFKDKKGALEAVRWFRNKLAHGSISFRECSGDETLSNLQELAKSVLDYMEVVVKCFNKYIDDSKYLDSGQCSSSVK